MAHHEDVRSFLGQRYYAVLSLALSDRVIPVGIVVFLKEGLDVPIARSARAHILAHYPKASPGYLADLPHILKSIAGKGTASERYRRLDQEDGIILGPLTPLQSQTLTEYEQEIASVLIEEIPHQEMPYTSPFTPLTYG